MAEQRIHVSRLKVGLITVGLVIAALVTQFAFPEEELALGAFRRVGLLMAAIWLAMPSGGRSAAWANVSRTTLLGFGMLVLAIVIPRFRPLVIPLLAVLAVLGYLARPSRERPNTRTDR